MPQSNLLNMSQLHINQPNQVNGSSNSSINILHYHITFHIIIFSLKTNKFQYKISQIGYTINIEINEQSSSRTNTALGTLNIENYKIKNFHT